MESDVFHVSDVLCEYQNLKNPKYFDLHINNCSRIDRVVYSRLHNIFLVAYDYVNNKIKTLRKLSYLYSTVVDQRFRRWLYKIADGNQTTCYTTLEEVWWGSSNFLASTVTTLKRISTQ